MSAYASIARSLVVGAILVLSAAPASSQQGKSAEELKKEIQAKLDAFPNKDTFEASVFRGSLVFLNYCQTCHGTNADGTGRAAKMYNPKPANLRLSMYPDAYKEMIIRKGGQQVGRSEFMPPWNDELTNEQIRDTINYLRSIAPADAAK
jgi:mono/diheme cytochrome c family protein